MEATFFVLGWVADRFPDLVREIERRGHEVATHGYSHRLLTFMQPEEFRADLRRSLEVLAKTASQEVRGFRAPSFSVTQKTLWAIGIMKECGIQYDSSVFPVDFHPEYGIPGRRAAAVSAVRGADRAADGSRRAARPAGALLRRGYFRLYPYRMTRWLMRRCNQQGRPVMFYLHPWEADPGQPRVEGLPWSKRFRHYTNLDQTEERLERLLGDFSFTSARKVSCSLEIPVGEIMNER